MNYYERHIGDYIRDTVGLSMLEDGAYGRLLDQLYQTEKPLPLDRKEVYRMARATSATERKAVDYVVGKFFERTDEGLVQKRAMEILAEYWDRPEQSEKKNTKEGNRERQRRSRERRKTMFETLAGHGVVPPYNTPMKELEALLSRYPSRPVTPEKRDMSQPVTDSVMAPVMGNHSPLTNNQKHSGGDCDSTVGGPVDNSASPPPLSAEEIGNHLVELEAERGKSVTLSSRAHEALLRLADRNIAMPVLLRAHVLACARRTADQDPGPVHPGFLEPFVDEALAEQRTAPPAPGWDETPEGVQAKADELQLAPQRADEHPIWFRRRVIKAAGDQHLVEREVSKAERMNPNEFEVVYRFFHGVTPGQVAA